MSYLKEELAGQMCRETFPFKGKARRGGERGTQEFCLLSYMHSDVTDDAGEVDVSLRVVLRNWNYWR